MSVNIVRFKFFKKDEFKYLSHLDVLALMERAVIRTGMPLVYSGGFHPKPKLSFSNPIPLGVQSLAEYCDIEFAEEISAEDFILIINTKLPDNLKAIEALSFEKTSENKIQPLMSAIDIVLYEYKLLFGKLLPEELDFEELFSPRRENGECEADLLKVKNSIYDYDATEAIPGDNIFFFKVYGYAKILKNRDNNIFKFNAFNEYFENILKAADIEISQVQKTGTYIFKDNILTNPIEIISG